MGTYIFINLIGFFPPYAPVANKKMLVSNNYLYQEKSKKLIRALFQENNQINILGSDEVVHLRGWDDWRLGDRLVFGTFESRIGAPQASFAAFLDFGNAWYANGEKASWLFTAGYELRVNIGFIVLAYGTAQDFNRWRDYEKPNNYLRMTLVNPF